MTVLIDNFSNNAGWAEVDSHVDSTQAVNSGVMTITSVTDYTTSAWTKNGFAYRDCIIVAELENAVGDPQIHVRETDEDNFIIVYIDSSTGDFILANRASGTTTPLSTVAIPDFDTSNKYTIAAKVFGNAIHATILGSDGKQATEDTLIEVSSTIESQSGSLCGVGAEGTASYTQVTLRSVKTMTTIVCLGDSNTDGNNIPKVDQFPQVMNARRILDTVVVVNSGKAGDNIAECEARIATEVAPYYVAGHENICIMQMGTNDRADGFTAAQSWTRYQSCIATAQAANFDVIVGTGFPNTKDDADNTQWNEDLNADILADEATYNYRAVRIWAAFGGEIGSGFPSDVDLLWVTQNNPHASEEGHLIFSKEYLAIAKNNARSLVT